MCESGESTRAASRADVALVALALEKEVEVEECVIVVDVIDVDAEVSETDRTRESTELSRLGDERTLELRTVPEIEDVGVSVPPVVEPLPDDNAPLVFAFAFATGAGGAGPGGGGLEGRCGRG